MKKTLSRIYKIGINPLDTDSIILRKQFLVLQGIFMSLGGVLWGSLLLYFNYPLPSIIPYGYILITIINFFIFDKTHNFAFARIVQTGNSLFLPFMLQWFLGGFEESGGVMIWSILSLVSSATYQALRSSVYLLTAFIFLTLFSLYYDAYFETNFNMGVEEYVSLTFLVINIISVSSIVFALMLYYVRMNAKNMKEINLTYSKLINSEKLAVLGQISAGVAHEINTPLGAIKSSAEESSLGFAEFFKQLPLVMATLTPEQKDFFLYFVANLQISDKYLSTKEERATRKAMYGELIQLNVQNARYIADRLVQVGIHTVTPELQNLSQYHNFEDLVMLTYNLLHQHKNNLTISLAVDKASRIVQALKSYLHTTGLEELEPVNLAENIETVLTIYHNRLKQGIEVVKDFEEIPEVLAYPDKLNQVWTNLIVNAIQAMNNKGVLTIKLTTEKNFVIISIKDTGKGIPAEIQDKIFDPFFTTKANGEGSGLGLGIIEGILKEHSSYIWFESEENRGTTFYVKLPVHSKKE